LGKKKSQKRTGRVAQGVGPEFKPQYCKEGRRKKKKEGKKKKEEKEKKKRKLGFIN
jgi:hypothetical protein